MRSGSSCPWGAVNWRIMLASLIGWHCATASGPWRCVSGPPVSAGSGSGVRPPPSHRGWSSSSSVCLHCALCTCLCQRIGSGSGGDPRSRDPRIWRRRRQWRRSVGRRRRRSQRGCVAARWGSFMGQRLPRLLHWWDCPCHRVWSSQPARRWLKNCPWQ